MLVRAPAKINLGLTICGKRADGYHDIETVMQQISLSDLLLIEQVAESGFTFNCTDPALCSRENLVWKAAAILEEMAGRKMPGVNLKLYKNIPVEAGLAGGSADAAATLKGLNAFWKLNLRWSELLEIGAKLGSDVPFCLQGGTALARGRGEILEKLPGSPFFWVVLALPPGAKISTAAAYSGFDHKLLGQPSLDLLIKAIRSGSRKDIRQWVTSKLTNTLETVNLPLALPYKQLRQQLRNVGFISLLSGSGPTLFMLFDYLAEATLALRAVEEAGARAYLCWTENNGGSDHHV